MNSSMSVATSAVLPRYGKLFLYIIIGLTCYIFVISRTFQDEHNPILHVAHQQQAIIKDGGEFVNVMYEPPNTTTTIPPPKQPLHVPAWFFHEAIIPPKYVTLDEQSATRSFVFVTSADAKYFEKVLATIQTVQQYFPSRKIVFYDLGLTTTQITKVKTVCQLEYRQFDFTLYPDHVKVLKYYAWKPLIIYLELRKHPGIFWIDASVRFFKYSDVPLLEAMHNDGGLFMTVGKYFTYTVTHGQMFDHISTNMTALKTRRQRQAGCVIYFRTKHIYQNVIMWMAFCALDKQCIASSDKKGCSRVAVQPHSVFSQGCHRYDQSLMNILMANAYGFDDDKTTSKVKILDVRRWIESSKAKHVKICNP